MPLATWLLILFNLSNSNQYSAVKYPKSELKAFVKLIGI